MIDENHLDDAHAGKTSMNTSTVEAKRGKNLSFFQRLIYAAGNFPVGFGPTAVSAWLAYYYYGRETASGEPIVLVTAITFGLITLACNVLNAFTDPAVGYLSDKTQTRWGRRKPWVIAGAPLLAISFFFLWTPITQQASIENSVVLFLALLSFWFSFTVVVAPYVSLLPEITPYDNERVSISAFMGLFEILGTIFGSALWPVLTGLAAGGALFFATGEQLIAAAAGVVLLVFIISSVLVVPESYKVENGKSEHEGSIWKRVMGELLSTFSNSVFIPYVIGVGFYRMAVSTVVFIAPFLASKVIAAYPPTTMDLEFLRAIGVADTQNSVNWEEAAGLMMALVLVGAALFFPLVSWLANKFGKRQMFILALSWFGIIMIAMSSIGLLPLFSPLFQGLGLFLAAAFPVSIAMVVMRPLLADVIDTDEGITGKRREGVYNGMEGFMMKVAAGLGPMIGGISFEIFGHSTSANLGIRLCGPFAGVCLLAAAIAFTKYPIRK